MIVRYCAAVSFAILLFAPEASLTQDLSKETPFTVKLVSPVSTKTNRKGDKVSAIVQEPEAYRGDNMEGVIKESKSGGRVKRESRLLFDFDTLYHNGTPIPVSVRLVSFTNSKGQKDADEEGEIVKGSSWVKRLALPFIVAVKGPTISFDSNSEFKLRVKQGHAPNANRKRQSVFVVQQTLRRREGTDRSRELRAAVQPRLAPPYEKVELSNNLAEHSMRPVALGRNYVHSRIMCSRKTVDATHPLTNIP